MFLLSALYALKENKIKFQFKQLRAGGKANLGLPPRFPISDTAES